MEIEFYKYHGAGNDFIMLDNFSGRYDKLTIEQIQFVCNRRFGIGADGLIKISKDEGSDFYVDYYNSDGSQSFCGNGARCSVQFVNDFLFKKDTYRFNAIDGIHQAFVGGENIVRLGMSDVNKVEAVNDSEYFLDTGSPHYIIFRNNIEQADLTSVAHKIRYSDRFKDQGVNVNLVEVIDEETIRIRTYERGVEDETLACGTGITAAALAFDVHLNNQKMKIGVQSIGGLMSVEFKKREKGEYRSIDLIGPAKFVYRGIIGLK